MHRGSVADRPLIHSLPPMRSSLPVATPDATETTTGPDASRVARAISCFTGASTKLTSWPFFAVNVTIVPSGTGLPEQSRTGSVSTRMPLAVRCPLMRKLHGTEATCWTTRRAERSLSEAETCNGPADFPELVRNQAMPSRDCLLCDMGAELFALN